MRLAKKREGGREEKTKSNCSKFMDMIQVNLGKVIAFNPHQSFPFSPFSRDILSGEVTFLCGGPLEFLFIVESTKTPAYRAVSMVLSELKDEVDAKIVVAGISIARSQKIHNRLVCT
ncbi:hypothetical protein D8674_035340 [Pyrus ussuriensis x Pyrus communis]|uniref:Uncharacterized protein n=1 Tax=Pyrus ussuriensis x Pyrus communis TaxID=2448454 RepID=A0A5N5GQJ3_9ROSA|nr:hypothetical protein D8674_035340 [Pyrus ussuriensis x Pyrus communis]